MKLNLQQRIIQMLEEKHLLTVSDFLTILEKSGTSYNKTSVYRALEQLINKDVVCRHHFSQAEASYELREHHHAHLVCTSCGSVQAGECEYDEPQKVGSFLVQHHHNTLFGVCGACQ